MATIIDSLLVVLGLDARGFDKGRKQTSEGLKHTRDEADKTGKNLEQFGKSAGNFFASLRNEAVGLFLAFQGASSVKDFVGNMIAGDAATGRLAKNLGMTTTELSAYGLAIKTVGGSAEEANAAFTMLAQAREQLRLTGTSGHDREFALLGFRAHDLDDSAKAFDKLAEAAQRMPRTQFYNLAHQMGLSDGVINLLELGPQKMRELVKAREADAAATEEQARQSEALQAKWADLAAKITALLRPEIYKLVDGLANLVDAMTKGKDAGAGFSAVLIGLGAAAVVLDAPFIAIGAAIALVIANLDTLEKKYAHVVWYTHGLIGGSDLYNSMVGAGVKDTDDIDRMIDASKGAGGTAGGSGTGAAGGTPGGAGGGSAGLFNDVPSARGAIETELVHSGFSRDQARGISAGIAAEGGGLGRAKNGAFGIGQWLGPRAKALHARYGANPTLSQQVEFLVSELRGGDRGGKSVTSQSSAGGTMEAYLRDFMRPQGAHNEHWQDLVKDIQRGYRALGQPAPMGGSGGGSSSVSIGQIVLPGVKDAQGFAQELPAAIRRRNMTAQANTGLD